MEMFYKITKEQADLIGRFEYAPGEAVDPYCSEQNDGTYLVSERVYELLKDNAQIKKVDFSNCEKIGKDVLDTKVL